MIVRRLTSYSRPPRSWDLPLRKAFGSLCAACAFFSLLPCILQSAADAAAAEPVADAQVLAATSTINEKRHGTIYLAVTNRTDGKISVPPIAPLGPEFLECVQCTPPSQMAIGPREARVFQFTVSVVRGRGVTPGTYLLVFPVRFTWEKDGSTGTGAVVASHEVTAGVFGESEILTVLGVPSFLLLPGFLVLATLTTLWGLRKPQGLADAFPWRPTQPEFWVLALPLSALMALAYARLAGRDYLEGYALIDVVRVWCASVALGAALWAGAHGVQWLRRRRLRWSFTPDDEPVDVLEKLHGRGSRTYLKRVKVWVRGPSGEADSAQTVYELGPDLEQSEICWVAPRIAYKWKAKEESAEAVADLQRKLEEVINRSSPGEAASLLAEGRERKLLELLGWDGSGHFKRPTPVDRADIKEEVMPGYILQERF